MHHLQRCSLDRPSERKSAWRGQRRQGFRDGQSPAASNACRPQLMIYTETPPISGPKLWEKLHRPRRCSKCKAVIVGDLCDGRHRKYWVRLLPPFAMQSGHERFRVAAAHACTRSCFTAGAFRFLILNRRRIALLNRKKGAVPFSGPEFTGGNAPLMTTVQR